MPEPLSGRCYNAAAWSMIRNAMSFGPQGKPYNFDSYVTATPPTNVAPAPPKQINAGDKKNGPPKPTGLGGTTTSNHGNRDTYFE